MTCFKVILFSVYILNEANLCKSSFILNKEQTMNEEITVLVTVLTNRYFSNLSCIVTVYEDVQDGFLQWYRLPVETSVLRIQVDLYNTEALMKPLLHSSFNNICTGYIIQLTQPHVFIKLLEEVTKESLYRLNPRLLFLPSLDNANYSNYIFCAKEMQYTPEVLVIDLDLDKKLENNTTWFKLLTSDWISYQTCKSKLLLECSLEECLETTVDLYPDKIMDMKGKELKMATFTYPPYAILEDLDGTEVRIAEEYARIHNCSLKVVTDDAQWGQIYENGSGDGILGAVSEDRADIGLGAIYLWYHEYHFLDFTVPYIRTGITCLAPRPQLLSKWTLPIQPFSPVTWSVVLSGVMLAITALYCINKLTVKLYSQSGAYKRKTYRFSTVIDTSLRTIGLLLLQTSTNTNLYSNPMRHLLTWLQFTFVLITALYSSGLASILTVPKHHKPIETVKDLALSSLEWGATHDAWIFSLRDAKEDEIRKILSKFRVLTKKQLHEKSLEGNFAFSIERLPAGQFAVGDYITSQSVKLLRLMKQDIYWEQCIIVVRKGSMYLKSFNSLIHKLLDSGLLLHWEGEVARKFMSSEVQSGIHQSTMTPKKYEPTIIQLSHVQGAFTILTFGLILAIIVFFIEIYTTKYVKKYKQVNTHHKHKSSVG